MNNKLKSKAGFTLVELIIALALTGIIITLTGSGLLAIMNANQRHQREINERLELEQAMAFMTDEIKMSSQIDIYPPGNNLLDLTNPNLFFQPAKSVTNIEPILVLTSGTSTGLTQPIVYYLAQPPKTSVWHGPRVIYRWGPTLMQDGSYSNGNGKLLTELSPTQIARNGVKYFNEALIDGISDRAPAELTDLPTDAIMECNHETAIPIPIASQRKGFYLCVERSGKAVKIAIQKQPKDGARAQSLTSLVMARSN